MDFLVLFTCIILLFANLPTALPFTFRLSPYAPSQVRCPAEPLTRPAVGLSAGETGYVQQRYTIASQSLRAFFLRLNANRPINDTFPAISGEMPLMGFASGGGSIRGLLAGAGVIQDMDNRDPAADASPLSGVWQGFSYHSGVSGGAWLLGALAGNSYATVSSLTTNLWISSFSDSSFLPFSLQGPDTYARLFLDITAKIWAGAPTTLADLWGRTLSLHLMESNDGGVNTTLSGLLDDAEFQEYQVPYPIFTALGVSPMGRMHDCVYGNNASAQYEVTPFEFGSWDAAIRSFALTQYMGSPASGGMAFSETTCLSGFDNLGFVLASSSNQFNCFCGEVPKAQRLSGQLGSVQGNLIRLLRMAHGLSFLDEYSTIPNPFVDYSSSQVPHGTDELYLVDGSQGNENIPLWPLIQPERRLDFILANDNSADTAENWPNGTALYYTYLRAQDHGLTTMPPIPPPEVIAARNPGRLPMVFGCYDLSKITILWLPNKKYSFASNIPDWVLLYGSSKVTGMIQNGNDVAAVGGDPTWPSCLGCVMLNRSNQGQGLPSVCSACFSRFCWRG